MNTFNRVKLWNTLGGKSAPTEPEQIKESALNQLERIEEELKETVDAIEEGDRLETLDGICDIDVTICGLMYLVGFDDSSHFQLSIDGLSLGTLDETLRNISSLINTTKMQIAQDIDVTAIISLLSEYNNLLQEHAVELLGMDYKGAISAVLDNNDDKYFSDINEALNHLDVYNSEGVQYELVASVDTSAMGDFDADDAVDLLMNSDTWYSIHRLSDDKIMKPIGFVGVDLTPFI